MVYSVHTAFTEADASVGNVTGSNSVNVFLGLGMSRPQRSNRTNLGTHDGLFSIFFRTSSDFVSALGHLPSHSWIVSRPWTIGAIYWAGGADDTWRWEEAEVQLCNKVFLKHRVIEVNFCRVGQLQRLDFFLVRSRLTNRIQSTYCPPSGLNRLKFASDTEAGAEMTLVVDITAIHRGVDSENL